MTFIKASSLLTSTRRVNWFFFWWLTGSLCILIQRHHQCLVDWIILNSNNPKLCWRLLKQRASLEMWEIILNSKEIKILNIPFRDQCRILVKAMEMESEEGKNKMSLGSELSGGSLYHLLWMISPFYHLIENLTLNLGIFLLRKS